MTGSALFSPCQRFRYTLTRTWFPDKAKLCVIGLNPSTADAEENDPTIRRCIGYADDWGYGGLLMLNLFAFRATLPKDMWTAKKRSVDIIGGPLNYFEKLMEYIREHNATLTVAAWGRHGGDRGRAAIEKIPGLHYLSLNKDGSPEHPLYLKKDLKPLPFSGLVQ